MFDVLASMLVGPVKPAAGAVAGAAANAASTSRVAIVLLLIRSSRLVSFRRGHVPCRGPERGDRPSAGAADPQLEGPPRRHAPAGDAAGGQGERRDPPRPAPGG